MTLLFTDLDRTLTDERLVVDPRALARVADLRAAGVRVVLATGRTRAHLREAGLVERFDGVVAENGAVILLPGRDLLEVRGVAFGGIARGALGDLASSFAWGEVLGSGPLAAEAEARARLDAAGVTHHAERNADEVMLLPPGVDKATGAARAARHLDARLSDAWAIGDGENDAPLLEAARVGVALGNAAPAAVAAARVHVVEPASLGFLAATAPLLRRRRARVSA